MEYDRFELFYGLIDSAGKNIQRIKAAKMKKYHLSAAHIACLCRLAQAGEAGLTQGQLVQLERIDRAQISRVLTDLRERQYVATDGGERQYKKFYRLTPEGQAIAAELQDIILELHHFVSQGLDPSDIDLFYRVLTTISTRLETAVSTYLE